MADIKFEVDDSKTYCSYTKNTAIFMGIPLLMTFVIIFELIVIWSIFNFYCFLALVIFQLWLLRFLKKRNIALNKLFRYLMARRTRVKSAIPKYRIKSRNKQIEIAKKLCRNQLYK